LSSDRSGYITGTAINLDGGLCPVVWYNYLTSSFWLLVV
jgi:hypothetical protein